MVHLRPGVLAADGVVVVAKHLLEGQERDGRGVGHQRVDAELSDRRKSQQQSEREPAQKSLAKHVCLSPLG